MRVGATPSSKKLVDINDVVELVGENSSMDEDSPGDQIIQCMEVGRRGSWVGLQNEQHWMQGEVMTDKWNQAATPKKVQDQRPLGIRKSSTQGDERGGRWSEGTEGIAKISRRWV